MNRGSAFISGPTPTGSRSSHAARIPATIHRKTPFPRATNVCRDRRISGGVITGSTAFTTLLVVALSLSPRVIPLVFFLPLRASTPIWLTPLGTSHDMSLSSSQRLNMTICLHICLLAALLPLHAHKLSMGGVLVASLPTFHINSPGCRKSRATRSLPLSLHHIVTVYPSSAQLLVELTRATPPNLMAKKQV
ncbi:hypothetical protein AG1IA_03082 [Rhizoctonia solani AG-1 IA]|uniref:Uncharacterized protein n=1 Tax=Thanatephorus cucumeris (strain AG1-IA) TaxID=983506 RepID=L8WXZ7_THACA|nr:hypothetical protein AG1IA_03082 [Rhizoctonia solani AG-1 IA]